MTRADAAQFGKCVAAGVVMGVVVWWSRGLPLPVVIPLGALVYGASGLAFGAFSLEDLRMVRWHLFSAGRSRRA